MVKLISQIKLHPKDRLNNSETSKEQTIILEYKLQNENIHNNMLLYKQINKKNPIPYCNIKAINFYNFSFKKNKSNFSQIKTRI